MAEPSSGDTKGSGFWTLLPTFGPATDDVKEYVSKVKFLAGICPKENRGMLAPRLALQCRGTAWHQVRAIKPELLTDPEHGITHLLSALSTWEELAELKTFELFDRAIYRTTQKSDESAQSFVNRLQVAFEELGPDTTIKSVKAFVLLKQSSLSSDDKKKILTMTSGVLEVGAVENAMRSLSTNVLLGAGIGEKKKVYPTNYIEPEEDANNATEFQPESGHAYMAYSEDDDITTEAMDQLLAMGDADALLIQSFEKDLEDMFQEIPDLQHALISYQEARGRIREKHRSRGFWPVKGGGKSGKGHGFGGKGFRKGRGKQELMERISRTHCKLCGEKGHWKAECPRRGQEPAQANYVTEPAGEDLTYNDDQVQFEVIESQDLKQTQTSNESLSRELECNSIEPKINMISSKGSQLSFALHTSIIDKRSIQDKINKRMNECKIVQNIRRLKPNARASQPQDPPIFQGCTNSISAEDPKTQGQAIVDTGASRSVIGIDNVPAFLNSLPTSVRNRVKEKPSRIGFRFGNNQIEYSFKQLRIPIDCEALRIWLVIEVVPKATPFLLSIHAMKKLGAVIDLARGTCVLQKVNKSIKVIEGKTGLLHVRISDLCQDSQLPHAPTITTQAFHTSSEIKKAERTAIRAPVDHADSGRSDEHGPTDRRFDHAVTQNSADDSHEPGSNSGIRPTGTYGTCPSDESADHRSEQSATTDRRDCRDAEAEWKCVPFRKRGNPSKHGAGIIEFPPGLGGRFRILDTGDDDCADDWTKDTTTKQEHSSSSDASFEFGSKERSQAKDSSIYQRAGKHVKWNHWKPIEDTSRDGSTHSGLRSGNELSDNAASARGCHALKSTRNGPSVDSSSSQPETRE